MSKFDEKKIQRKVSQKANRNLSPVILLGGLSINLDHLKIKCATDQFLLLMVKGVMADKMKDLQPSVDDLATELIMSPILPYQLIVHHIRVVTNYKYQDFLR